MHYRTPSRAKPILCTNPPASGSYNHPAEIAPASLSIHQEMLPPPKASSQAGQLRWRVGQAP